jgi:hypothetical protein
MNLAIHRFAMLSFVVFLGSLNLAAQKPADAPEVYVLPASTAQECPVSMHAQHGSGGGLLMARQAPGTPKSAPQAPSQQIHLTLKNWNLPGRVVTAKVTVRGTNGKVRFVPVISAAQAPAETAKALDINFEADGEGQASTEMQLAGFTSVQSITLDSLTFTDGSTWIAPKASACRTAPDPFMLVSAR